MICRVLGYIVFRNLPIFGEEQQFLRLVRHRNGKSDIFTSVHAFQRYYLAEKVSREDKTTYLAYEPDKESFVPQCIYLDLDAKKNLDLALDDAIKITRWSMEKHFLPRVYFSGSKGFAVYLDFGFAPTLDGDVFQQIRELDRSVSSLAHEKNQRWTPLESAGILSEYLTKVVVPYKERSDPFFVDIKPQPAGYYHQVWGETFALFGHALIERLNLKTVETSFLGDVRRVSRVPYTIHPKTGLYCTPLSLKELSKGMDFIQKLAKRPTPRPIKKHSSVVFMRLINKYFSKALNVIMEQEERRRTQRMRRELWGEHPFWEARKHKIRPCFLHGLEMGVEEGKRDNFFLALAAELGIKDFTEEEKVKIIALCVEKSGLEPNKEIILSQIDRVEERYVAEGRHWTRKKLMELMICYQEKRLIGCVRCTKEWERLGGYQ